MPVIILERIPLPSLQTYSAFSVVLLSCALFYAHQIVSNVDSEYIGVGIPESVSSKPHVDAPPLGEGPLDVSPAPDVLGVGKQAAEYSSPADYDKMKPINNGESANEDFEKPLNYTLPYDNYVWNIFYVMTVEIWCVWTLINMAYCCLILMGKVVQKVVFGELRVSELQHLKDKFWNFVFYKFIFIFGVMNVQTMEEVVLWVAWFTMLGFFHLLTQLCKDRFEYVVPRLCKDSFIYLSITGLHTFYCSFLLCKDRFEYLSFSPTTPKWIHVKLLSLLFCILLCCSGLMVVCALTGLQAGITIFSFMTAECLLLGIRALYVVVRYAIHLWDINLEGVWENRSIIIYYTELVFELAALSIDFGHHLHMLLWGNIFLSMASLVICMQLRYLFYEFQRRIRRHKNYLRVVHNMESRFTMASKEDLEKNNDDCAICWEKMELARKLPCAHLFHNSCLRSWLEQDTSCPTCRMSLNERPEGDPNGNNVDGRGDATNNMPAQAQNNNNAATTNHFFHFDGSRYVSWLPSFSVEVTHTQLLPGRHTHAVHTSQLDNMARQVHGVFQHMPLNVILDDLRITRSVDDTIDNILEGRLLAPPTGTFPPRPPTDHDAVPDDTTPTDMERQVLPSSVSRVGATALHAELSARSEDVYEAVAFPDSEAGSEVTTGRSVSNLMGNYTTETESNQYAVASTSYRDEVPSASGSRFSKSSRERECMLQERKNDLLEEARRRYLSSANLGSSSESAQHTPFASPDLYTFDETLLQGRGEVRLDRRELAFRAAQRRLQQQFPLD